MSLVNYDKWKSLIRETSESLKNNNKDFVKRLEPQIQVFRNSVNDSLSSKAASDWFNKWVFPDSFQLPSAAKPKEVVPNENVLACLESLRGKLGQEIFCSEWTFISQDTINAFSEVTGDSQWVHTDVERAKKESPFRSTIAHGLLILSMVPAMRSLHTDANYESAYLIINSGFKDVVFESPVKPGKKIRLRSSLREAKPAKRYVEVCESIIIEDEVRERTVARATVTFRIYV